MKQAALSFAGMLALGLVACSGGAQLSLNSKGADYKQHVYSPGEENPETSKATPTLGTLRLAPEACEGHDLKPTFATLGAQDLKAFLDKQGIAYESTKARSDLEYLDLTEGSQKIRLRVATLDTARAAGRDLHEALLEHGPGSWGVHRSNIAVLGPVASTDSAIDFSLRTKLACWGVLTVAGRDDNFVVSGGYTEL